MNYKYKNPLKNGYTKVSKDRYKEIITEYKQNVKYEIYENENCYLIHQFDKCYMKIINLFLIPLLIIKETKVILKNYYKSVFQKRTGHFRSKIIKKY